MQIKEVMSREVKFIRPDTTIREAAQHMRDCDCGYLPVGENDRLIGAVTDRDIIIRAIADGQNPEQAKVQDIMTGKVVYCFEDDSIEDASARMQEQQIRRLVVLDRNKRMKGVVSLGDIARASNDNQLTGETEKAIAQMA